MADRHPGGQNFAFSRAAEGMGAKIEILRLVYGSTSKNYKFENGVLGNILSCEIVLDF
jgi:hypothetical protein